MRWAWQDGSMELVVATVGRPHGLRGDVFVDSRTDEPEQRFAVGQVLNTDPDRGPLTVASARVQNGRWVLRFAEIPDRTAAETLTRVNLTISAGDSDEENAWYSHELLGMSAQLLDGTVVGKIAGIDHGAAHGFLVLRETNGAETLIPFVKEIVPDVNKEQKVVTLNPPGGLLASDAKNLVLDNEALGDEALENQDEHLAEEAAELAAPLAPKPGTKLPGEIAGTIEGEDVDTHQHLGVPLQPETSES